MDEKEKGSRFDTSSKFLKALLLVIAALLIFVGPTYVVYVLNNVINVSFAVSMVSGFAIFMAGLVFLWYLIRRKIVA